MHTIIFWVFLTGVFCSSLHASIIIEIEERELFDQVTLDANVRGDASEPYTLRRSIDNYYQSGDLLDISIKNEDTMADICLMVSYPADPYRQNSWWLKQSYNFDTSPPTVQTSYYSANFSGNRQKFRQIGDFETVHVMRLVYLIRGLRGNSLVLEAPLIPQIHRNGFTIIEWGVILK